MITNIKQILKNVLRYIFKPAVILLQSEMNKIVIERYELNIKRVLSGLQSCGVGVKLNGEIFISRLRAVSIGNNVHIGSNAFFKTEGGLTIGDNTHISRNVTIYTVNHNYNGTALPYDQDVILKPCSIGKNVWIGMNVCITPGVKIGDGAIIGIGSIVTRDIPENMIVGGSPAKTIKNRDVDHYQLLLNQKKIGGVNGAVLSQDDVLDFYPHGDEYDHNIFFIVTTGRSGSTSIASALNNHSEVMCSHEPREQLIRLSTEYAHQLKSKNEVKEELYDIFIKSSTFQGPIIYGESDQKYFNLIPLLNELLPRAKFIWLIRDAYDVVASTYARGWFRDNEYDPDGSDVDRRIWAKYRINGYKCGVFTKTEWEEMSDFERNCWYWSYVNSTIENSLLGIPSDQQMKVKLSELPEIYTDIQNFLGLSIEDIKNIVSNKAMKGENPVKHRDWSDSKTASFRKFCGLQMDKWF